jgi:hypothetical protein
MTTEFFILKVSNSTPKSIRIQHQTTSKTSENESWRVFLKTRAMKMEVEIEMQGKGIFEGSLGNLRRS